MIYKFYSKTLSIFTLSLFFLINSNAMKLPPINDDRTTYPATHQLTPIENTQSRNTNQGPKLPVIKMPAFNFKAFIPGKINERHLIFFLNKETISQEYLKDNSAQLNFSFTFDNSSHFNMKLIYDTHLIDINTITIFINLKIKTDPSENYKIKAETNLYINNKHKLMIQKKHQKLRNITSIEQFIRILVGDLINPD